MSHSLSLREQRCLFTEKLSELVLWIRSELGVMVAFDEVTVHSPRAARLGVQRVTVQDAVHKQNSFHHRGLAADLLIYADLDNDGAQDDYVSDGSHPIWRTIAIHWEQLHPLCTSGIRWNDANHVSLGEGSKETPL